MTNLQSGGAVLSGTAVRRIWLLAPVVAGLLLALALAAGVLMPLWNALQRDSKRMRDLEQLRDEVMLLRTQIARQSTEEETAKRRQAKLVELIVGNGNLSTFLAMVDEEAHRAGIRLDLYEPQAAGAPDTPEQPEQPAVVSRPGAAGRRRLPKPAAPVNGAIAVPGLEPRGLLLSASGRYPQLLDFLRRLERRNVLVLQSDLSLSSELPKGSVSLQNQRRESVQLKLTVNLYARPGAAAAAAAAAPSPAG